MPLADALPSWSAFVVAGLVVASFWLGAWFACLDVAGDMREVDAGLDRLEDLDVRRDEEVRRLTAEVESLRARLRAGSLGARFDQAREAD